MRHWEYWYLFNFSCYLVTTWEARTDLEVLEICKVSCEFKLHDLILITLSSNYCFVVNLVHQFLCLWMHTYRYRQCSLVNWHVRFRCIVIVCLEWYQLTVLYLNANVSDKFFLTMWEKISAVPNLALCIRRMRMRTRTANADADGGRRRGHGLCVFGRLCVDTWRLVYQW